MTKAITIKENIWYGINYPFTFVESVKSKEDQSKRKIMRGIMMPGERVSRNGVLYEWNSVIKNHKQLINKPVMKEHRLEEGDLPLGHFIESEITTVGEYKKKFPQLAESMNNLSDDQNIWVYAADIDPEEKDIVRKIERGDLRHVSIQLKAESESVYENGMEYEKAIVEDIVEGSLVSSPGFLDTTAVFAEKLKTIRKEEVDTTSGAGAIGEPVFEDELREQITGDGKHVHDSENPEGLHEHPELWQAIHQLEAKVSTLSDTLQEPQEPEALEAESLLSDLGEEEVEEVFKQHGL